MLQPSHVPPASFAERLRAGAGRRTLALGLVLLVEALLLLMLLTLGADKRPGKPEREVTLLDLQADEAAEDTPEPAEPEPARADDERPAPQPETEEPPPAQPAEPSPPQPAEARPLPVAPPVLPTPVPPPQSAAPARVRPAPPPARSYGPPDTGRPAAYRDTERVGTAPNGEPLYAAAWYREPADAMLRDYLSTARGPGWGLIACRTAPGYRVEECVGLEEYPRGSQITRAVLAAAWEFRVRPPRLGGQPLVGAWVRIRIDYGTRRP